MATGWPWSAKPGGSVRRARMRLSAGRDPAGELPVQRRHRGRQGVEREKPGLEHLALLQREAVDAADEHGLVVHLGPVPVAHPDLEQAADAHGQSGLLADLTDDRLGELLDALGE